MLTNTYTVELHLFFFKNLHEKSIMSLLILLICKIFGMISKSVMNVQQLPDLDLPANTCGYSSRVGTPINQ